MSLEKRILVRVIQTSDLLILTVGLLRELELSIFRFRRACCPEHFPLFPLQF